MSQESIFFEIEEIRCGKRKLDEDPAFARLLNDKSVVVVGPARTLLGQKQGRFIDSHDIVVRINDVLEHFPPPPHLGEDIGTRADIIYCNQVILRKNIVGEEGITHGKFFHICDQLGVKNFVCTNNSLSYDRSGSPLPSCPKADRAAIADFEKLLLHCKQRPSLRVVYGASETLMRWLGGNWARTGFITIMDLLGFGIRNLSVTGMTFYHGGGHLFAHQSADLHPKRNRDGTSSISPSGQGHDSFLEVKVMNLLRRSYGENLVVDGHLERILEESNHEGIPSHLLI